MNSILIIYRDGSHYRRRADRNHYENGVVFRGATLPELCREALSTLAVGPPQRIKKVVEYDESAFRADPLRAVPLYIAAGDGSARQWIEYWASFLEPRAQAK